MIGKSEVGRQKAEPNRGQGSGGDARIADCRLQTTYCRLALSLVLCLATMTWAELYRAPTGVYPRTDQAANVWVYFADKGFRNEELTERVLARSAPRLDVRAVERRLQALGAAGDFDDIAPYEYYISEVAELGAQLRSRSAWLNAASFRMAPEVMARAAKLPFVHRITPVAARREPTRERYYPLETKSGGAQGGEEDTTRFKNFYRLAYDQNRMLGVPAAYARGITGSGVRLGLLDTGLKRRHQAVRGVKVVAEHDFLSRDRLFTARSDNAWTPETISSLSAVGLVQDPVVCSSAGIWSMAFVADTVRYETPVRGLFYSVSTDEGANWTQPVALYFDQVYSAVHRPAVASRDSIVYVAWQSALRSEENSQVLVGHLRNGVWQGTVPVLPGASAPDLFRKDDRLYIVALGSDSSLWFNYADIATGTPYWNVSRRVVYFPELVREPWVVRTDAGAIYTIACGWRTGRVYLYRSTDEGGTFEAIASPVAAGAEQPRLGLARDTLRLLYKDNSATPFTRLALSSSTDAVNWSNETVADSLPGVGGFDFRVASAIDVAYESQGQIHVTSRLGGNWTSAESPGAADFSCSPRWLAGSRLIWVERGDNNTDIEDGDSLRFGRNQADHGTRMVSIIAGFREGSMVGVAPGVEFLIAKNEFHSFRSPTIGYEFVLEEDTYIEALEWAERHGADIVSSSLGYTGWYNRRDYDGRTAPISVAAGKAVERGVLVVTAMGNRDTTESANRWPNPYIVTPGDAFNVITAGGVEKDSTPWHTRGGGGTGCGPTADGRTKPDLVAMGDSVTVVAPDSSSALEGSSGTSCATALIAGCAALVKEAHPDWSAIAVRETLFHYASRTVPDDTFGWGIPSVAAILDKYPPEPSVFTGDEIGDPFPNPLAGSPKQYFPIHLMRPASIAALSIFSMAGELILKKDLNKQYLTAPGRYDDPSELDRIGAWWDGRNGQKPVASGLYYAVLRTGFSRAVRKFAIVR